MSTETEALIEIDTAIGRLDNAPALLPVRPLVIDSDVLLRNIVREARPQTPPTKLLMQARMGSIRPFIATHQVDEVRRHLPRVATEAGVDVDRALAIFEGTYLPLLWQVDVGSVKPTEALVEIVSNSDAADAPIAKLGVLLGVRVVTANRRHFKELAVKEEWLVVVAAYADVGMLDGAHAGAAVSLRISGEGIVSGARAAKSGYEYLVDRPRVAMAVAAVVAILVIVAIVYFSDPDRRAGVKTFVQRAAPHVKDIAGRALAGYAGLVEAAVEAEAVVVASRLPAAQLTLEQRLARVLASSRHPVPTQDLVSGLSAPAARRMQELLVSNPIFVPQPDGWTLGNRAKTLAG
jgi:hypothetical protein